MAYNTFLGHLNASLDSHPRGPSFGYADSITTRFTNSIQCTELSQQLVKLKHYKSDYTRWKYNKFLEKMPIIV